MPSSQNPLLTNPPPGPPPAAILLPAPASSDMKRFGPDEEVDCLVIGTGAGGAPLLARLAQAGLKVLALEAGPWHHPATDFATDEHAQNFLFWNDERLSAGRDPLAFGKNNSGTGVGGSTLHYTAYTPRVQPDDLRLFADTGQGVDWPLEYADLEPYYDELEQFLGISGPASYPWGPVRRRSYPLAPLPLNGAAQLMQRACARLGIRTSPAANAALSARYYQEGIGWREACTNRGFCQAGCSTGAKASMDVTFIPLAVKHGAEIRPDSFVTVIERDAQGRVTGVVYTQNGEQKRQRCRHLFVCAGRHRDAAPAAAQQPGPEQRAGWAPPDGPHRPANLGHLRRGSAAQQGHSWRADLRRHPPTRRRRLRGRLPAAKHRRDAGHAGRPRWCASAGSGARRSATTCSSTTTSLASTSWASACRTPIISWS